MNDGVAMYRCTCTPMYHLSSTSCATHRSAVPVPPRASHSRLEPMSQSLAIIVAVAP
ncbi:hypothetical protein B0I35DRAFT_438705 [Stachybotrys elegans]|uniref:Uncharacterized protein n=1 Tax=Stachybotrys elegans TaxID=80388 RepID=A0A8K0WN24_9HYPO|nr:hypothetical protein B0I35DRAFT_438705 [Stachybotrys elegans]